MSLYRQLYAQLRTAILTGGLPPGTRIPATRTMAAQLGVARNTVLSAVEQLTAEGYLEAQQGSGTIVTIQLSPEMTRYAGKTGSARQAPHTLSATG